jgi:hypothetical protein
MIELDNIPKKTVFTVPDGYFDKLPGAIQARIPRRDTGRTLVRSYALRYALPAILVAAVAIYYYNTQSRPDPQTILATVDTSELILYVQETTPVTTDDLLESFDISTGDVEAIENEVYNLDLENAGDEFLELELNNL